MKKNIDIPDEIMDELLMLAIKEKRRGKTDPKNFIEDLVITYVKSQQVPKLTIRLSKVKNPHEVGEVYLIETLMSGAGEEERWAQLESGTLEEMEDLMASPRYMNTTQRIDVKD